MKARGGIEQRVEEGQTDDVIEMGVGEKHVPIQGPFAEQRLTQYARAGADVKHEQMRSAAHFEARGVAAVAAMGITGTGNGAAHAPESHEKILLLAHTRCRSWRRIEIEAPRHPGAGGHPVFRNVPDPGKDTGSSPPAPTEKFPPCSAAVPGRGAAGAGQPCRIGICRDLPGTRNCAPRIDARTTIRPCHSPALMTLQRTGSNWTAIAYGLGLACLAAYHQFKLPPALPAMLAEYGYDRTLAGGFMAVYAVAGLTLSWSLGRFLSRAGIPGPVLGALALTVAGSALTLMWPEQGWLVLGARAIEGVGFAVLAIAGPVLANASAAPRHLPLVVGLTASWIPVGQITAIALAPPAFAAGGWQGLWWAGIAASLGFAVATLRLRTGGHVDPAGTDEGAGLAVHPAIDAARFRRLMLAGAIFMLWAGQYFAYMTWLPQYLVETQGLSPSWAALGTVIPVVVLLITNFATGMVLRAGVPVGPLLCLGLVVQAVVWWLVPVTGGGLSGLVSLLVYGIAAGICPTCLFAMPSVIVGAGRPAAAAFGVLMTGRNIGVLAGPVAVAEAFKLFGGWEVAGPMFGALTTVALGLGVWLAVHLGGAGYGTRR
ncbi:MAG: MFS transporter [Alphaproteobacteria bacterium]|nr:MAG: MFS transporter [Alphaproteobacteria bacterium]